MQKTNLFHRFVALLLVFALVLPGVPVPVSAEETPTDNVSEPESTAKVSTVTLDEDAAPLTLQIEWQESEFKDGTTYNLYEPYENINSVRLKVSYGCKEVREEGYAPGELVITVKGIGNVGRTRIVEAVVGADKESVTNKVRDWSYTWNKATDTYTLYNNEAIDGNSVFSGYFELVWEIEARESVHGYTQNDVQAIIYLPDGGAIESQYLTFNNQTRGDTFQVYIQQHEMYSYEGLTAGIENPENYAFIRYDLGAELTENSRGLKNSYYLFDPDTTGVGTGAIVISPLLYARDNGDGTYLVNLEYLSDTVDLEDQYLFVAYPKSTDSYGDKNVYASLTKYGAYYEGDDSGNTGTVELATATVGVPVPKDFTFTDIPGDIYQYWKDTYYDKFVHEDVIEERGGDVSGGMIQVGTTETFYLEGELHNPNGTEYTLEIVDDFLYILKNNGEYHQLEVGEYEFRSVNIPGALNLKNYNNITIAADTYTVKIYTAQGGNKIDTTAEPYWTGVIKNTNQYVSLPDDTTAIAVVIVDLKESVALFSIPVEIDFHINDTSSLEWEQQDNLTSGQVVNTSFIKVFYKQSDGTSVWLNGNFTEDNYIDDTNLSLASKDLELYGNYLDREEDHITLYPGEKDNYRAWTYIDSVTSSGSKLITTVTIGANFYFTDNDPDKFSLYTVLPEVLSLYEYRIEEDIWDIMELSGFDLTAEELAAACTPEIIRDYQGSGRVYIALHFDFGDTEIPKDGSIRAYIKTRVDTSFLKKSGAIHVRSAVIIDKEINEYAIEKKPDDGSWNSPKELFVDIDRDGNTEENLAYDYSYTSHVYADSSQFQVTKYVSTTYSDGPVQLPDVPNEEFGGVYQYLLSVRNGNSTSTGIIVTDILENGPNAQWKGSLVSVDLSECEELGLTGTVYYSTSNNPGSLDSGNWSTTMGADTKAILVDFGEGVLKEGQELVIIVNMKAPEDTSLKDQITENGFSVEMTMMDSGTGNVTKYDNLESNLVQVKLTPALRSIVVTKIDAETRSVLEGAMFELFDKATGQKIGEATSNGKGFAIFHNVPANASYILKEIQAPYGYEKAGDQEIAVTDTTAYLTVVNQRMKGRIEIYKESNLDPGLVIPGAEYTLYDGSGNVVMTAVTDANGTAVFENLPWGSYTIRETASPVGYQLNETVFSVEITRENVHEVKRIDTVDPQDDINVLLQKYVSTTVGEQTTEPLSGAVFELVRVTTGGEKRIGLYVTDKDGRIQISELPYGEYYFREYRTPAGYITAENVSFTLSPDNKDVSVTVYDQRKFGTVTVTKKDNLGSLLQGIEFTIYDETKTWAITTVTTDEYGIAKFEGLEWGTYYVKETKAPSYYVMDDEWKEVVIDGDSLTSEILCINETVKGIITLTKTNENGKVNLPGAEYTLYTDAGAYVGAYVTDENGCLTVENLEWGSYYFKETKAPAGYSLSDETIRFSVNHMNAGITQEISVTDVLDARTITLTKRIKAEDINFANGNPSFIFKVAGTDYYDDYHEYYQIVVFSEEYVRANTDAEGYVSQSVVFSDLVIGEYLATEMDSSRYYLSDIPEAEIVNGTKDPSGKAVKFLFTDDVGADGKKKTTGSAAFVNTKYENQDFSHNDTVTNVLKQSAKLTALTVSYGATTAEAESYVNTDILTVKAFYDDGTVKDLTPAEYKLSISQFPNQNGSYTVKVSYTDSGITKSGNFTVTLFGMKLRIVSLRATINGDSTINMGSQITPDMFTVVATYNDTSTRTLSAGDLIPGSESVTITSPGYPNAYDPNMTESVNYWQQTFEGAAAVLVTFSADSRTEHSYDWIQVYDKRGNSAFGKLTGTSFAGQTYTVEGNYVKIAMASDSSVQAEGFSATLVPLYRSTADYTVSPATTPSTDGQFDVTISLNLDAVPNDGHGVSTTVSMTAQYPVPKLINGQSFQNYIPGTATSVVFTDTAVPAGYTKSDQLQSGVYVDVSDDGSESVVAWMDGTTMYVSTQRGGVRVVANEDSANMFMGKSSLTSIDMRQLDCSRVESMTNMCKNCTGLTSIKLPSDMTFIPDSAFYGCSSLTTVDIPSGVTSIGTAAFRECTSLNGIILPAGITEIKGNCFYYCTALTSIVIPEGVTAIRNNAFYGCSSLKTVTLPSTLTRINNYSFYNCQSLTNVEIPNGVTFLGAYAFYYCQSLTSITIPGSVSTVEMSSFCYCKNLKTVVIEEGVETIADSAFSGCYSMVEVTLPSTLQTIMSGAFRNCDFESITIPSGVTYIDDEALSSCGALLSIVVDSNNPSYSSADGVLFNKDMTELVRYPAGRKPDSYIIPNTVKTIGDNAFFGCIWIENITIPDSVTYIGDYAFSNCMRLLTIAMPDSVTEIGDYVFNNSGDLQSVILSKNLTSLGARAFELCNELPSIEIPDGVTVIDNYTFYGCTALESIIIPDTVTTINKYAFHNCSNLANVYFTGTQAQWEAISVAEKNDPLAAANVTFSYDAG